MDKPKGRDDEIFYLLAFLEKKERRSVACTSKAWQDKVRWNMDWVGKCNCASALLNKWMVKPYLTSITLHDGIYQYHDVFDQCFTHKLRHVSICCPEEDIDTIFQLLLKAPIIKSIEVPDTINIPGLLELVEPYLKRLRLVVVVNMADTREKLFYVRSSSKASFNLYEKMCTRKN